MRFPTNAGAYSGCLPRYAPSYDLNNRLHSFWMDQSWRRKAVRSAQLQPDDRVVDVACGTGDLTLAFVDGLRRICALESTLSAGEVIGIDFTYEMLPIAVDKWSKLLPEQGCASTAFASSTATPKACRCRLSVVTSHRSLSASAMSSIHLRQRSEFFRILRPGGRLFILEFSIPTNPLFRALYNFYFKQILPRTATWISGDKTGAYKYLPQSVHTFIGRETMVEMLAKAGFVNITQTPLTLGICICYRGFKA